MRIMTSNIWGDFFNNPVKVREDGLYTIYKRYNPDVIGFQEAAAGWYESSLFEKLSSEYRLIGVDRFSGDNSTPMAVKKEYDVIACGREKYVGTPDASKTVTWAVLEKDGEKFAVCNTHFWWMRGTETDEVKEIIGVTDYTLEDHCNLRAENASQLSDLMIYLHNKYSVNVYALGDMNAVVTESLFDMYAKKGIKNLFDVAMEKDTTCSIHGNPVCGEDGNFYGKEADDEYIEYLRNALCLPKTDGEGYLSSIDHIIGLGEGFKVKQYRVVTDTEALNSSDHSPVYVDIEQ